MPAELDEYAIARALGRVAKVLPARSRDKALELAYGLIDPSARVRALSGLLNVLPLDQKEAASRAALTAARSLTNLWLRVRALLVLALRQSPAEKDQSLHEAFETILRIPNDWQRGRALNLLYGHLPDDLIDRAIDESAKLQNLNMRTVALSVMAARLSDQLAGEVLRDIPSIGDEHLRAAALNDLAGRLSSNQLTQALAIARGLQDQAARADALSGLAQHLSGQMPNDVLQEAINAANSLEETLSRADSLLIIAERSTMDRQAELAQEIWQDLSQQTIEPELRAEVLINLIKILPPADQPPALQAALTAARSIENAAARAEMLSGLIDLASSDQRQTIVQEILSALQIS